MFWEEVKNNQSIRKAYEIMQKQYVLQESGRIEYAETMNALTQIYEVLLKNIAWMRA